jgi:hypothetical protein
MSTKRKKKVINADLLQPLLSKRSKSKIETVEVDKKVVMSRLQLEMIPGFV